jgi:hypothetical protein
MAGKTNSFTAAADWHFVAPQVTPVNAPDSTSYRSKRRKKREPTAMDVLTTG